MFATNVPKHFGEAILTSTYLINRMPSRVLQFKTPYDVLGKAFLSSRLFSSIPFRIFGCFVFVHVYSHNRSKLDPKATNSREYRN
ncbi:LOW QUALITY PROTEIN: hypothetical protein PanWU01x14_084720 [Parasponia andersonii]|uniref:Uncharacterized protein n=1 Tax=Parasponia andersonii TaxID=3476 RepID=A0A2P5D9P5_PARAD|nr:LOW QUALITY PROTEIN: hypothetical protein PanWU01x14_084720 [Parasponia andersonii]